MQGPKWPDVYVPQPHNCFHQIEKDRLLLHQRRVVDDLQKAHALNRDLRQQLSAAQLASKRKPRHRSAQKRKHEEEKVAKLAKVKTEIPETKRDEMLVDVFAKLFKITDIIALWTHPDRATFETNAKFAKLLKIYQPLSDLNAMVGLDAIKTKTFDIIAHYALNQTPADLMHMVISGPPGVGKTEVGKIIGKIVLGLGILKSDKFVCARRSELIGEYLGQTAPKTQQVIDSAMGGCLFIDEAYSLGHPDKRDSFSKECIDCLNQNLTEKKGQFLCIIAGYEKELDSCFFGVNKGLRRRFPVTLNIAGYSADELFQIFLSKVNKDKWTTVEPTTGLSLFKEKHKFFHFFAGDAECLFQQAKFVAAGRYLRSALCAQTLPTLTQKDIEEAYQQELKKREGDVNVLMCMFT